MTDLLQPRMPIPGCVRRSIEIIEGSAMPWRSLNSKMGVIAVDGHRLRCVSLDFDRICTNLFGSLDDLNSQVEVLAMIGRHLGDNVSRITWTDTTTIDLNGRVHLPPALTVLHKRAANAERPYAPDARSRHLGKAGRCEPG